MWPRLSMRAGWMVATMVLSSAYKKTDAKIEAQQTAQAKPFSVLGGGSDASSSAGCTVIGAVPWWSLEPRVSFSDGGVVVPFSFWSSILA